MPGVKNNAAGAGREGREGARGAAAARGRSTTGTHQATGVQQPRGVHPTNDRWLPPPAGHNRASNPALGELHARLSTRAETARHPQRDGTASNRRRLEQKPRDGHCHARRDDQRGGSEAAEAPVDHHRRHAGASEGQAGATPTSGGGGATNTAQRQPAG